MVKAPLPWAPPMNIAEKPRPLGVVSATQSVPLLTFVAVRLPESVLKDVKAVFGSIC